MQGKCKVRNLKREKIITVLLLLLEHVKMVCANNLYEVSETQVSRVGSGKWKCYNTVAGGGGAVGAGPIGVEVGERG